MASSAAEICNLALLRIGAKVYLTALTDVRPEAQACAIIYPQHRDALLELFDWPFAARRAKLTATATARTGWAYAYALPGDCVAPRMLNPGRSVVASMRDRFEVEANDALSGRLILTDAKEPELLYTALVTSPPAFSPLFTDALAWRIAAELVMALPVKPEVAVRAMQQAQLAEQRAAAAALSQRLPDPPPDSEFISVRG